jgi:6-phosphogluconolactonase
VIDRRLFLTLSLALVGISFSRAAVAADAPRIHVFIGTYTQGTDSKGIYHSWMNTETGELTNPEVVGEVKNPSFVAIHPSGKFLYSVAEIADFEGKPAGGVQAFEIDASTGKLKALNSQSSGGAGPCHCVVDREGKNVLVANYGGGSVACLPINADGTLKPASTFIQHEGKGPNERRQEGPHAHSINIDKNNTFAVAADLGLDKLLVYKFDADLGTLVPNNPPSTSVEPGSGPRHFAFHPNGQFAYVINEMNLTVTAFRYAPQHGVLYGFQTISTVPEDVDRNGFSTAEVQVHPSGKFLYGSNRGHHSIAMFEVDQDSGRLTALGQEPTKGKTPRNFAIDPSGKFLLAENQDSGTVVVFAIDQESGKLKAMGAEVAVPKPVCIKFLK